MKMPRQDTKLESQAAEFLVLAQLLLKRIPAYKTYTNMPGYDLVATNPDTNRSARIQVKSRWRTGAVGFLINNFDSDFVVVTLLNRGRKEGGGDVRAPEYFVFPTAVLRAIAPPSPWGRIDFKRIPNLEDYREKWHLVTLHLEQA